MNFLDESVRIFTPPQRSSDPATCLTEKRLMATDPIINEFMFNPTGSDTHEFIEVKGDADTDYSDWSLIVVDGDGSVAGKIDNVFDLGTTNADGYWVTPFQTNKLQNGTQTVMLVKDFTGSAGDDLDTDNDGTFDSTPWSLIGNTIAVSDGGSGDLTYAGAPVLTGDAAAGASRVPDGTDTGSPSDWTPDDPDLAGIDGYGTTPEAGTVLVTPGAANATQSGSSGDGSGSGSGTGSGDDSGSGSGSGDTGSGSGSGDDSGSGTTTPTAMTIQQVNGEGYYSTVAGTSVTVTGVVTAVDTNGSIGFWIQQQNKDSSLNGSTGIFVYGGSDAVLPSVGDILSVTGTVTNYAPSSWDTALTLPEIDLSSYSVTGTGATIDPTVIGNGGLTVPESSWKTDMTVADDLNKSTLTIDPSDNAMDFYRSLVGQVVTLHDTTVVNASSGNATWVVADGGNGLTNSRGAIIESADNQNTQRIEIYFDSGVGQGEAPTAQVGDSLGDITGVLTYYNGIYEIEPTTALTVTPGDTTPQTATLVKDPNNLLVSDYNIDNFDALDPFNADRLTQLVNTIINNLC